MSVFCLDVCMYVLAPDVYSACGIQILGLLELESQVVVGCMWVLSRAAGALNHRAIFTTFR